MSSRKIRTILLFLLSTPILGHSQEYNTNGLRAELGLGSHYEGIGILYSLGYMHSFSDQSKYRLTGTIQNGHFAPGIGADLSPYSAGITALNVQLHSDLIRYRAISIIVSGGYKVIFHRWNGNEEIYGAVAGSTGVRIAPLARRTAWEFKLINFSVSKSPPRESLFLAVTFERRFKKK